MTTLPAPPVLRPGDRVGVVAPSGPLPHGRLDAGLAVLRSWGLEVVEGARLRTRSPHLAHLAASDRERAADLCVMWRDPSIAAVLAGRGGYGAARLLEHLDPCVAVDPRPASGRVPALVGFSDITALLLTPLGARGIHGPVVTSLGDRDDATRERLRTLLFDGWGPGTTVFAGLTPVVAGDAVGRLAGGNLTVLASLVGTPTYERHLARVGESTVLVLEDVGEAAYRLDRALTQLRLSGFFEQVAAVVVGDLTGCGPQDQVDATLTDRLGDLGVPVWRGAPVGHGPRNLAFPLHVRVRVGGGLVTVA